MKNFKDYLVESEKTYNYRIKVVGDIESGFFKALEDKLKQFDIVKISGAKTTPVQTNPADFLAFENLLDVSKDAKVAIIGGGGTARAAIGALNTKVKAVDVLLRSENRMPAIIKAAPNLNVNRLDMSEPLDNYDLIIQTTPSNVFDQYVSGTNQATGVLLEALYKPWPTKLVERYEGLGGRIISGKELLVEQALHQIELFSGSKFDFSEMRLNLLALIALD
jgi:shikimate dehydrogenase